MNNVEQDSVATECDESGMSQQCRECLRAMFPGGWRFHRGRSSDIGRFYQVLVRERGTGKLSLYTVKDPE